VGRGNYRGRSRLQHADGNQPLAEAVFAMPPAAASSRQVARAVPPPEAPGATSWLFCNNIRPSGFTTAASIRALSHTPGRKSLLRVGVPIWALVKARSSYARAAAMAGRVGYARGSGMTDVGAKALVSWVTGATFALALAACASSGEMAPRHAPSTHALPLPSADFAAYRAAAETAIADANASIERRLEPDVIGERAPFELTPERPWLRARPGRTSRQGRIAAP
jgi:hypothetical protein